MSVVKIEEVDDSSVEVNNLLVPVECCNQHYLINSTVAISREGGISFIDIKNLNTGIELEQLRKIVTEKDHIIFNLERENAFLREQVKALNILLDQLSTSTRNLAGTKNEIRIRVDNTANVTLKKWYRRPKVILSGSAVAVLFSIYMRYKIKNW